jgi:protein transport protein SEC23
MLRIFAQNAQYESLMAFNGVMEVQTSSDWAISGAIGPCVSAHKSSSCVGELEIGECKTCAWRIGGLAPDTTLGVYFEVVESLFCVCVFF